MVGLTDNIINVIKQRMKINGGLNSMLMENCLAQWRLEERHFGGISFHHFYL